MQYGEVPETCADIDDLTRDIGATRFWIQSTASCATASEASRSSRSANPARQSLHRSLAIAFNANARSESMSSGSESAGRATR
jgi:hypothetical protein